MRLSDWMKEQDCNDEALGNQLGVDRVTVSRIRRGLNRPSWKLVARIKHTTRGAVTADDFVAGGQFSQRQNLSSNP
jgi:transcriptional regulator with XRE-family HTH domain